MIDDVAETKTSVIYNNNGEVDVNIEILEQFTQCYPMDLVIKTKGIGTNWHI